MEIEQAVVDEIRGIGHGPALRREMWPQVQLRSSLRREHGGLKREVTRYHAEILRLVATGRQDDAMLAQIVDLHDRIARAETRIGELRLRWIGRDSGGCAARLTLRAIVLSLIEVNNKH